MTLKNKLPSYSILENAPEDYTAGFEVQSGKKEFISWDTTFEELQRKVYVRKPDDRYNFLIFKVPVRVGKFLFRNFNAVNPEGRNDIAVQYFNTECYDTDAPKNDSYHDIYTNLLDAMKNGKKIWDYKDLNESLIAYELNGMRFDASYKFNRVNPEEFFTHIHIANHREYPELLVNKPYEDRLQVSSCVIIKNPVKVGISYKEYAFVKRRPPLLAEYFREDTIIWRDDYYSKIGFADSCYSVIFDWDEFISLQLNRLSPAKGPGGSELQAKIAGMEWPLDIFCGKFGSMDEYAEQIESVIRKPVVLGTIYSDC